VDTGTACVFRIEPGGAVCHVVELSKSYWVSNGGGTSQVDSQSCDGVAVTSRGVTFRCGGRDVLIPAVNF
jgi:hypothetical protein